MFSSASSAILSKTSATCAFFKESIIPPSISGSTSTSTEARWLISKIASFTLMFSSTLTLILFCPAAPICSAIDFSFFSFLISSLAIFSIFSLIKRLFSYLSRIKAESACACCKGRASVSFCGTVREFRKSNSLTAFSFANGSLLCRPSFAFAKSEK